MIALTSCWHLDPADWEMRLRWIDRALGQMKAGGVRALIHCGDLFNIGRIGGREAPAPTIVAGLRGVIEAWRIPMFVVEGNHDQNEAPHPSAIRALDGCPFIAHMGASFDHFLLPVDGYYEVAFMGLDWAPRQGTQQWKDQLWERFRRTHLSHPHIKQVLVFGHVEPQEFSHGERPWPQPSLDDLEILAHEAKSCFNLSVRYCFGHIHKSSIHQRVRMVGALMRRRWDEKSHEDGWDYYVPNTQVAELLANQEHLPTISGSVSNFFHRVPLNGPRYLEIDDADDLPGFHFRDGDVVRCRSEISAAVSVAMSQQTTTLAGELPFTTRLEVVQQPVLLQTPSRRVTELQPGMGPEEALRVWLEEDESLQSQTFREDCLSTLREFTLDRTQAVGRGVEVTQVVDVTLRDHVDVPDRAVVFRSNGWNTLLGASGTGKTTLMEAVFAGLFGYWPTPKRKSLWGAFKPNANPTIRVGLCRGEETLLVTRGRKNDAPFLDVSRRLGLPLTEHTQPTKVQPMLTNLVGDPETWLRVAFLTQDADPDLVESGPEERHKALQQLLGLEDFVPLHEAMRKALNLLSGAPQNLQRLQEDLRGGDVLLHSLDQKTQEAEHARRLVRAELTEMSAELHELEKFTQVYGTWSSLNRVNTALERLGGESDLTRLQHDRKRLSDQEELLQAKIRTWEMLDQRREKGERRARELNCVGCADNLLACPLIDSAVRARDDGALAAAEINELGYSVSTIRGELTQVSHELRQAEQRIKDCNTVDNERRVLQKQKLLLEQELRGNTQEPVPEEEFVARLQALRARCNDLTKQDTKLTLELGDYARQHLNQRNANNARIKEIEDLTKEVRRHEILTVVVHAFSRDGIPRSIIEKALPGILEQVQALINQTPALQWLRLTIDYPFKDDPKAVPNILASVAGKGWVDASVLSGGQRAVVRLLLRLAYGMWVSRRPGYARVLILDEPSAAMSEELAGAVGELLKSLVGEDRPFSQGICATHSEALANILGGVQKL